MKFTTESANAQNAKFDETGRRRKPNVFALPGAPATVTPEPVKAKRIRQGEPKPLLNKTETRARDILVESVRRLRGEHPIWEQAFTLRLDPPFKSYRPDLATIGPLTGKLCFIEVKAPHKFARAGIAKAACAAKTYPLFRFELWMWKEGKFEVTVLSP